LPGPYQASSLPAHELAELHRLMTEEFKEVAIFFMNVDGIITTWNRAAEKMKGYTADDAIGSHLGLLHTDEDQARGRPQHNILEAKKHGFYKEETWRKRKDGSLFWARIALTALRDHSGQLVGLSKVTVDLTEHKLLEQCVKEKEEIGCILRAANAGTWAWHHEKNEMEVSANFLGLLGYAHGEMTMTFAQWLEFVDRQDRTMVAEKFEAARAGSPHAPS
jgi:PAS domain S-box-containing protein